MAKQTVPDRQKLQIYLVSHEPPLTRNATSEQYSLPGLVETRT